MRFRRGCARGCARGPPVQEIQEWAMAGLTVAPVRHAVGRGRVPLLASDPDEIEGAATPRRHAVEQQRTRASVALAERMQLVEVRVEPSQPVLEAGRVLRGAELHHLLE